MHALFLLCLLLPLASLPDPAAAPPAGDELVARAGDLELTRDEYADWLVRHYGVLHLDDFVGHRLVLRAAEEAGAAPTEAEVERAYEAERDYIVEEFYRGDLDFYEREHVARKGYDLASYEALRKDVLRVELAQRALALRQRVVTDEEVRRRYGELYGVDGERVVLEVVFFNMYAGLDADAPRPEPQALRDAALERARLAIESLRSGAPWQDVLAMGDPIRSEFVRDGRIDPYRKDLLGVEVERAVTSLDEPGGIAQPVSVYNGCYVVRLVAREPVPLEAVRDEIAAALQTREPDSSEIAAVRRRLLEEQTIERILR